MKPFDAWMIASRGCAKTELRQRYIEEFIKQHDKHTQWDIEEKIENQNEKLMELLCSKYIWSKQEFKYPIGQKSKYKVGQAVYVSKTDNKRRCFINKLCVIKGVKYNQGSNEDNFVYVVKFCDPSIERRQRKKNYTWPESYFESVDDHEIEIRQEEVEAILNGR